MDLGSLESRFDKEIRKIRLQNPTFKDDDAFVFWFVNSWLDDEEKSEKSLTGKSNDKGVDALWIDPTNSSVNIVQGKFRKSWGKKNEKRTDLFELFDIVSIFWNPDLQKSFFKTLDSQIQRKLKIAIDLVTNKKFSIKLYYVTSGKVGKGLKNEVYDKTKVTPGSPEYLIYDHNQLMKTYEDWLEGAAPGIPEVELPIDFGNNSQNQGVLFKRDIRSNIESWIISMSTQDVSDIVENAGIQLFARNIRGFLGEKTKINEAILRTIEEEPENFWYYNNGITMVCNSAEKIDSGRKSVLNVTYPQIINGQQTAKTLTIKSSPKAQVLVKVIKIPREGQTEYFTLVNNIVKSTNWQNKIDYVDLASNDHIQIDLQKSFRSLRYLYRRKNQTKSEARDSAGFRVVDTFDKSHLAKCVIACIEDPSINRMGVNSLFDPSKPFYDRIFHTSDPDFYLSCYFLEKFIKYHHYTVPKNIITRIQNG